MYKNHLFEKVEKILKDSEKLYPKIKKHEIIIEWNMDKCEEHGAKGICEIYKDKTYRICLNPLNSAAESLVLILIHEISHIVADLYYKNKKHGKVFNRIYKKIYKKMKRR